MDCFSTCGLLTLFFIEVFQLGLFVLDGFQVQLFLESFDA
jgi:hypothetical protein